MPKPALLALADGTTAWGTSIGAPGATSGELVFNTAMSGYQEILTDPSYRGQIVTLTYPHIGNVGCNVQDLESSGLHLAGLVIRDLSLCASSWRSRTDLSSYLTEAGVVAIAGVDTRMITRRLRTQGAQGAAIVTGDEAKVEHALALARSFPGLDGMDLATLVTTPEPYVWDESAWSLEKGYDSPRESPIFHVVAFDFGVKRNILRLLVAAKCRVTVVPARTRAREVLALAPDGVVLSNGPGDPEPCDYAINTIAELLDRGVPLLGICLGYQLLALAAGAKTKKMKFGHHGANHPVVEIDTGRVSITSQNHGFAVDESSLTEDLVATHRSLFDGSLQGFRHRHKPAFGFQGHPEASPGPQDIASLFDRFVAAMRVAGQG